LGIEVLTWACRSGHGLAAQLGSLEDSWFFWELVPRLPGICPGNFRFSLDSLDRRLKSSKGRDLSYNIIILLYYLFNILEKKDQNFYR